MQAIISYGNYFNHGKHYQVRFVYENEVEAQAITSRIKNVEKDLSIIPHYTKYIKESVSHPLEIIEKTNIPKELLLPFISNLIKEYQAKIIIREQEFTTFDPYTIQESIDRLHINVILNKGVYCGQEDTYYVTFLYATDEQREEISYDLSCRLKTIMHDDDITGLFPIYINRNGKIPTKNGNTIGTVNIPEKLLSYLIKRFVEDYDMIVNIGNEKLKDKFDNEQFQLLLQKLELGRSRTKKRQSVH